MFIFATKLACLLSYFEQLLFFLLIKVRIVDTPSPTTYGGRRHATAMTFLFNTKKRYSCPKTIC